MGPVDLTPDRSFSGVKNDREPRSLMEIIDDLNTRHTGSDQHQFVQNNLLTTNELGGKPGGDQSHQKAPHTPVQPSTASALLPHKQVRSNPSVKAVDARVVLLLGLCKALREVESKSAKCLACLQKPSKKVKCRQTKLFSRPGLDGLVQVLSEIACDGLGMSESLPEGIREDDQILGKLEVLLSRSCSEDKFKRAVNSIASALQSHRQVHPKNRRKQVRKKEKNGNKKKRKAKAKLAKQVDITRNILKWYIAGKAQELVSNVDPQLGQASVDRFCEKLFSDGFRDNRVVLIDCRSRTEFGQGHVRRALNITDPAAIKLIFFGHKWIKSRGFMEYLDSHAGKTIDVGFANQIISDYQKLSIKNGKNKKVPKRSQKKFAQSDPVLVNARPNAPGTKQQTRLSSVTQSNHNFSVQSEPIEIVRANSKSSRCSGANFLKRQHGSREPLSSQIKVGSNRDSDRIPGTDHSKVGVVLVFYTGFGADSDQQMLRSFREHDRLLSKYPELHYPEVYAMEGGYPGFSEEFRNFCWRPSKRQAKHARNQVGGLANSAGLYGQSKKAKPTHKKRVKLFKIVKTMTTKHPKGKPRTVAQKGKIHLPKVKRMVIPKSVNPVSLSLSHPKMMKLKAQVCRQPPARKVGMRVKPVKMGNLSRSKPQMKIQPVNVVKKMRGICATSKPARVQVRKVCIKANLAKKFKTINLSAFKNPKKRRRKTHKKSKKPVEPETETDSQSLSDESFGTKFDMFNKGQAAFSKEDFQKQLAKNSLQNLIRHKTLADPDAERYRRMDDPKFKNDYSEEKLKSRMFWRKIQSKSSVTLSNRAVSIK